MPTGTSLTNNQTVPQEPPPPAEDFRWYLAGGSVWMGAQQLQQFLLPWLLVGVLATSPTWVGYANLLIALPGFVFMLLGGIRADRMDGRRMLLALQSIGLLVPLVLVAVVATDNLGYWWVVACGLALSAMASSSEPPRAAILNRVTTLPIQQAVTLYTAVGSVVGLGAMRLGGELETLGLVPLLLVQAALIGLSTILVGRITPAAPVPAAAPAAGPPEPAWRSFHVLRDYPLIRQITVLNFVSAIFNAGAYIVVLPFLITQVYGGDALFFAQALILFWLGSIGTNLLLYRVQPLPRPGRLLLWMQLTRVAVLLGLWAQPPVWLMLVLVTLWGANQGVTTPLSRGLVQQLAPASHRARIMAVFLVAFMASAPLGSVMLGWVIAGFGILNALLPGAVVSLVLFVWGVTATEMWRHGSD